MPHSTELSTPAATFTAIDEKVDSSQENAQLVLNSTVPTESLPYWLINVPRSQWPSECPSFLRDLSPKNIRILSMPDEAYKRISWEMVKEFVSKLPCGYLGVGSWSNELLEWVIE